MVELGVLREEKELTHERAQYHSSPFIYSLEDDGDKGIMKSSIF
jgi:hypothetical protein